MSCAFVCTYPWMRLFTGKPSAWKRLPPVEHWPHQWAPRCSSFRGSSCAMRTNTWSPHCTVRTTGCLYFTTGRHTYMSALKCPSNSGSAPPPFNTRFFRPISESAPKLAHDLFSHFCTAHQYAHIHRPKHVILCAIIIPRPIQVTYGKGNE